MSKNIRIALIVAAVVAVWMASGIFGDGDSKQAQTPTTQNLTSVQVHDLTAQTYTRHIELVSESNAEQMVTLAAQTAGDIIKIYIDEGSEVKKGQKLIELDVADRKARLTAAKADVKAAKALVTAARNLANQGYKATTTLAEREAALAKAKRELAAAEDDLANATFSAPFTGRIENVAVDEGDYLAVGSPAVTLLGTKTFLIVGYAAQNEVQHVHENKQARAQLANGAQVSGTISFVARSAEPHTRTFRVEMKVDGEKFPLPVGISARMFIPAETVQAYKIPHAAVVLDDEGNIGVRTVDAKNRVRYKTVTMLADTREGMWVTGLPPSIRLITRGQLAVGNGEKVVTEVVEADS